MGARIPSFPRRSSRFAPSAPQSRPGGPMTDELEELAALAASGDRTVVPELLQAIRAQVQRRVAIFRPYREDAEEAVQDTLFQVANKIHTFKATGICAGWLTIVATNRAREPYRSLK